ncbi:hypothetical protein F5B20DRAFT_220678 [Whalleya microplaca]|nr:hypothetical protein F5B20DRAFT_220678 [Whalleya microplaca]
MDSKVDSKPLSENLPPPPYTANEPHPESLTSYLQHHVASLPDRIRERQQARTAQATLDDTAVLSHIVLVIEEFLTDIGAQHTAPRVATLTLVPDAAVPKDAVLSGMEDMRRRGEFCRVSRVTMHSKSQDQKGPPLERPNAQNSSGEQDWASGQEFDGWGRFGSSGFSMEDTADVSKTLWWRDEEMAHRLAGYLQPKKEKRGTTERRPVVKSTIEQRVSPKKEKKGWFRGKGRSDRDSGAAVVEPLESIATVSQQEISEPEKAQMNVSAQEVAFRRENEFGILESINGWALVVVVEVKL